MWTFDGEEWIEEGGSGSSSERKPEVTRRPEYQDVAPELQVIEHIPTPTRTNYVPPFPL